MGSGALSLTTKGLLFSGTVTSLLIGVTLFTLHAGMIAPASGTSPLSGTASFWLVGILAAALICLSTGVVIRWITAPLARLAHKMTEMAESGRMDGEILGSGYREMLPVEEAFRHLLASLDESRQAREKSYVEAVAAMVTAADARDHETSGHSFRVTLYALALARSLNLPEERLRAIEWGALLHDVGKMVVPDEILRKESGLTPSEWNIMRQHPSWGYDILSGVSFLYEEALDIVHCHHEHWDGQGYPRGLAGEEIPLGARIFAVVDSYDAITSDRPYRRARSHAFAIAELREVAGLQLDPQIVEAFGSIPEIELRRLRDVCRRNHPGLALPAELLAQIGEGQTWPPPSEVARRASPGLAEARG